MNKIIFFLCIISLCTVTRADTRIALLNINYLMSNALAVKDLNAQLKKAKSDLHAQSVKKERILRKKDAELSKQRDVLAKQAFNKKLFALQHEVADTNKSLKAQNSEVDKAYVLAIQKINRKILEISYAIVKEKKIDLLLPKNNVIDASEKVDELSVEVLQKLNKTLSSVHMNYKVIVK